MCDFQAFTLHIVGVLRITIITKEQLVQQQQIGSHVYGPIALDWYFRSNRPRHVAGDRLVARFESQSSGACVCLSVRTGTR